MSSERPGTAASSGEEVRAYIAEMVEQLAQMALSIGDADLAVALREAVGDDVMRFDRPAARRGA